MDLGCSVFVNTGSYFTFIEELLSVNLMLCVCVFVLAFHIYLYFEHFMYVYLMYVCDFGHSLFFSHTHTHTHTHTHVSPANYPRLSTGNDLQLRIPQCILYWVKFVICKYSLINKLYDRRFCHIHAKQYKNILMFFTVNIFEVWSRPIC